MKRYLFILSALFLILPGCTKVEKTRTSGIDTIDNTQYFSTAYYYYGFTFSSAKLVATYPAPGPDITVYINSDSIPSRLTLQASNLKPSFFKVGDYVDEEAAKSAFNDLKSFSADQWLDMADPINENQIWIFRTGRDTYAKVRIISIVNEIRETLPYGECKFEWVYQSDGSLTFPK